jgi:hypothetical protein
MLLTPSWSRRRRRASRWKARPKSRPTRSRETSGDRRERQRVHSAANERLDVRASSTERARDERRSLSHRAHHGASCGSGTREGRRQSGPRARVLTRAEVAQRALSGEEGGWLESENAAINTAHICATAELLHVKTREMRKEPLKCLSRRSTHAHLCNTLHGACQVNETRR